MSAPCQVLIADDHQIVLDGLRGIIETSPDFAIAGTASTGREVISLASLNQPQLLLMDLNMPGMDGLEVLQEIKTRFPATKVLILTMYDSLEIVRKALELGADGYLLKEHGRLELLEALQQVRAGEQYLSEKIKKRLGPDQHLFADDFQKKLSLTEREVEILRLIAQSYTNKEIGDKLFISEFTVQTHRRNLKRKLKAEHTADLVRFAYDNGISKK